MAGLSVPYEEFDKAVFMALAPVLVQCFGLIFLGFLAGQLKLLTKAQANGLGIYVTLFALPAMFFTVMVSMDFSSVDWYVVMAVSLGKAIIFFLTMIVVLGLSRGKSIGLAGLLAIFTSQSNDVALAYPVLRLIYPDLAAYIYLFAPVQLVILNPMGYFALEWHKARERAAVDSVIALHSSASSQMALALACKRILNVMRRVMLNPLFFMTLIGVIFNFLLKHKLPDILDGFFKDLGASFSATALFYLGFSMVGRIKRISRREIYILIFILLGKVFLSPFITRAMTALLLSNQPKEYSVPKSSFAFLYAAAPTAPPVFLFASNFGIVPEVVGVGLVIGTFLYAPIMFIFAGMATLVHVNPRQLDETLDRTAFYLSWASLLCCTWTLIILAVTKKAIRMPYRFLVCIITSVMIFCSSLAIGSLWKPRIWVPETEARLNLGQFIEFVIFFTACTGSRVWTTFLCIALLFQVRRGRSLSCRVQVAFGILGFVIPAVLTLILTLTSQYANYHDFNPAFRYGKAQLICSTSLLVTCLSISLLTFLCIFRSKSAASYRSLASRKSRSLHNSVDAAGAIETNREVEYAPLLLSETGGQFGLSHSDGSVSPTSRDCLPSSPCDGGSHQHENEITGSQEIRTTTSSLERSEHPDSLVATQDESDDEEAFQGNDFPPQLSSQSNAPDLHRFLILIILLMVSMFFGICICLWRLVRETETSVFVLVEFVDQVLNFGQGILIFAVFGIVIEPITKPLANCISAMRYWVMSNLSLRSLRLARQVKKEDVEQFVSIHLSDCMKQICTSLRLSDKTLNSVFYFEDFHRWTSRKFASQGRYQSREATSSLLMALNTMNLIRRLSDRSTETGGQAALETSNPDLIHFRGLEDSPILFQYLQST